MLAERYTQCTNKQIHTEYIGAETRSAGIKRTIGSYLQIKYAKIILFEIIESLLTANRLCLMSTFLCVLRKLVLINQLNFRYFAEEKNQKKNTMCFS